MAPRREPGAARPGPDCGLDIVALGARLGAPCAGGRSGTARCAAPPGDVLWPGLDGGHLGRTLGRDAARTERDACRDGPQALRGPGRGLAVDGLPPAGPDPAAAAAAP